MLNIEAPGYKYCPFCGRELVTRDEDGHRRKWCPVDNWTYYPNVDLSAGIIGEKQGKYLLVKRNREPFRGKWMFPAGFVAYGEHPEETAVRELKEETGYEVKSIKFLKIEQVSDDVRAMGSLAFYYSAELGEQMAEITDTEENSEMGWFTVGEFPEIAWEGQRRVAADLVAGRL